MIFFITLFFNDYFTNIFIIELLLLSLLFYFCKSFYYYIIKSYSGHFFYILFLHGLYIYLYFEEKYLKIGEVYNFFS